MPGLEGTSLGRYQLLGRLGRGGMSEVYLAYDERANRNVALKVVSSSQSDYLERFQREAEAIIRLHHDHILPAYDFGDQEPWHYLVMPNIEHGTLRDRLDKGALSLEDAGEMLDQIASALQTAHNNGIIHRDIKPSNILMRDDHYAYLADFGLAKAMEGGSELTQTGALLGTPEYMSPDLADGPATTSSDIYALGVVLYQMITGRVPFTGETPVAVYMKHVREQPLPPSFYNPDIPHSVDQVVLRALEKDPRRRYQSPQELAEAFEQARLQPSVHQTQEMPPYKTLQEDAPLLSTGDTPIPPTRRSGRQARQARQLRQNRTPSSHGGRKLVLPGNPAAAPTSVFSRRRRVTAPIVDTAAVDVQQPPLITQAASADPITPPLPARRRTESIHTTRPTRNRNSRLTFIIITVGLLLFVVLPLSLIYFVYRVNPLKATPTPVPTAVVTQAAPPTQQPSVTTVPQSTPNGGTTPQAQATTNAIITAATSGTPLLIDSLSSNANTNGSWEEDSHCVFTGNTYHIKAAQTNFLQQCAIKTPFVASTTTQVDVTLLKGHDANLLLRINGDQFYDFGITSLREFFFRRHDTSGNTYSYLLGPTSSNTVAPLGQKNTLLVVSSGSSFQLFINNIAVGKVTDNNYSNGQTALACGTVDTTTGEASFSNFKVYSAQ